LAMAVATLWMIAIGSDLEVGPNEELPELPDLRTVLGLTGARRPRRMRLFRLGQLWLLVQLIQGQALSRPRRIVPEPTSDGTLKRMVALRLKSYFGQPQSPVVAKTTGVASGQR